MDQELKQYKLSIPKEILSKYGKKEHRFTLAAGGLIFAHHKVLLDRSDASDLWSIPGGIVKVNESPQQTVVRELKEELNLNVEVLDAKPYMYYFTIEEEKIVDHIYLIHFLIKVEAPAKIKMGGDIVDYKWETIGSNFRDAYPNVKPAVDYYMNI